LEADRDHCPVVWVGYVIRRVKTAPFECMLMLNIISMTCCRLLYRTLCTSSFKGPGIQKALMSIVLSIIADVNYSVHSVCINQRTTVYEFMMTVGLMMVFIYVNVYFCSKYRNLSFGHVRHL